MKRCGRSNNATGLRCYSQPGLYSPQFLNRRHWVLPVAWTLVTLALAVTPVPGYAASAATDPSSPAPTGSFPESTTEPSAAGAAASAVPAPVAGPKIDADGSATQGTGLPETTTEIPSAVQSSAGTAGQRAANAGASGQQVQTADYDDGIIRYEHAKNADISGPPIGTLDDFMSEGDITSPLGFEVREDKRRLKSGEETQGLLIVDVFAGSPAARAGLHPYHRAMRDALETAAVAGAMFCPPVVLLVPVFDQVRLGETYDLIIGVDGSRVTNFLDFQDQLRDVQAGEVVYFSIVRNGTRMQIPVPVPSNLAGPTF
jgi:hypothetical protein